MDQEEEEEQEEEEDQKEEEHKDDEEEQDEEVFFIFKMCPCQPFPATIFTPSTVMWMLDLVKVWL